MNLLLDTQSFIWYVLGDSRLSRRLRSLIEDPKNPYKISIASLWELAIKDGTGKLRLGLSLPTLIQEYVLGTGIEVIPISIDHILKLRELPMYHRDPFDRIIISQGIVENLSVITTDPVFQKYPIHLA